jgi:hypothetical protein
MNTTTRHDQALALANLKICQLDLTATHSHAVAAAGGGLDGTRHARADELVQLLANALVFTRQLSMVVEGDLRADQEATK